MKQCKVCNNRTMPGYDYCKQHFISENKKIFLDNSDPNNMGIFQWARYFLPDYVPYKSPKFHADIILELFKLYDPILTNRFQRQLNIKAYRGASKSTLINMIFVSYVLCNNGEKIKIVGIDNQIKEITLEEKFIVVASETQNSAEDFVVRVRNEIQVNKRLKYFYKEELEDVVNDETGQWTRKAFKFNECYVLGVGVEQQIRGKIKEASRPTLIILDDVYSENNVLTENSRYKVKKWFDQAVYNTVDNVRGKIIFVGTVVHEDTILVENEKSGTWKNFVIPIMNLDHFESIIKKYLQVDYEKGIVKLPYDDIEDDAKRYSMQARFFEEVEKKENIEIAWREKDNLYMILLMFKNAVIKRNLASIYQEYFHIIVHNEMMRIKPEHIIEVDVKIKKEGRHIFITTDKHTEYFNANIEIGVDFGTGTNDGDDDAIVVAAALHNGEYIILKEVSGKFGERDTRFYSGDFGRVEFDRNKIEKKGAMDEAIRLAIEYNATAIKVGYSGTEKSRINVLRQLIISNKIYNLNVYGRMQRGYGDKSERIFNALAPLYQSRRVYHNKGLDKLNYQLKFLQAAANDDIADALECALYNIVTPSKVFTAHPEKPIEMKRVFNHIYNIKRNTSTRSWRI